MRPFRFAPIAPDVAERVRSLRSDDFGNHALTPRPVSARPGSPCRICLTDAEVGQQVLLFSYTPFPKPAPYRAIGPVYVHLHACEPFVDRGEIPEILRERQLSIRAFDADDELVRAEVVEGGLALVERATSLFQLPRVHHVDVHLAKPGCFACRLERN